MFNWLFLALACTAEKYPVAFDWAWDPPTVAAVRVWPPIADGTVPRRIEALVVGDGPAQVAASVCGWSRDESVWLGDPEHDLACFDEPSLVDALGPLPATWTPGSLRADGCVEDFYLSDADTGDTGHAPEACASVPLLLVTATVGDAQAAAAAIAPVSRDPLEPTPDPAISDPRLEVVDGPVVRGGTILVRFSVSGAWTDHNPYADPTSHHRWFVDRGRPWGTSLTGASGIDEGGRPFSQNWIELPAQPGPVRLAVARLDTVPVWATLTLEVP